MAPVSRLGRQIREIILCLDPPGAATAQLNDWNDERLRQKQLRAYAHVRAGDLAEDIRMLVPVDAQIRVITDGGRL